MDEPLEDGMTNGAEEIIAAVLEEHGEEAFVDRLLGLSDEVLMADCIALAGRLPPLRDTRLRRRMVAHGLSSDSLRVRDAAIQAVEMWEDRECLDLLEGHEEPEDWLDEYMRQVIEDVRG